MKQKYDEKHTGLNAFNEFSRRSVAEIDEFLEGYFTKKMKDSELPFIVEPYMDLQEYCLRDGKRIRPLIMLISYLGYKKRDKGIGEIIKIASTLELMHSFLLIQDDIIDKSTIRRGGRALHIVLNERYRKRTRKKDIGNDIALLLGDVLISNAIEIIGNAGIDPKIKSKFLVLFAKTYELTAWGQVLDSLSSLPVKIDVDDSIPSQISTLKTAYYTICNPMLMGQLLAGRYSEREADLIRLFSIPLGLAFQIRDDILGVFGDKEETGKSSESDIIEGKLTILVYNTLKTLGKIEFNRFMRILSKGKKTKSEIGYIKRTMERSGALDSAMNRMLELTDDAKRNLKLLKIRNEQRTVLSGLIEKINDV